MVQSKHAMKDKVVIDPLGNEISCDKPYERVVSLVPSITELVIDLVGPKKAVGRTKFCIHPQPAISEIPKIGGTKNPRIEDIIALQPDLFLANKEENRAEDVTLLQEHAPVYVSEVKTLEDNYSMITDLGRLFDKESRANEIIELSKSKVSQFISAKGRAAYLIWQDPIMVAGGDTFINAMMSIVGKTNVFEGELRYPTKTVEEIVTANPDYIFLSSEPYPFKAKHVTEWEQRLPSTKIRLVDGEFFSWYGSRLTKKEGFFL